MRYHIASSKFTCTPLNPTTFLLVESDQYGEHPFIYVKLFEGHKLIVLSDTGCGTKLPPSTEDPADRPGALRSFLETVPIPALGNVPLNPPSPDGPPSFKYLIICTHCHYDHILGIPSFLDAEPRILASAHGKSFIERDLPKHSLCEYLGVPTPQYKVSYWAKDEERVFISDVDLGIEILHTPGHTPDELAWYDAAERHLYVGDSFYERVANGRTYTQAILFPPDGDVVVYMKSLAKMVEFVARKNDEPLGSKVKVSCGHVTAGVDGAEILSAVTEFFTLVLEERIPVKKSIERGGEMFDLWQEEGDPRFSLQAPRRLVDDARKNSGQVRSS